MVQRVLCAKMCALIKSAKLELRVKTGLDKDFYRILSQKGFVNWFANANVVRFMTAHWSD